MSTQARKARRKVGEILLSQGYINQQQLDHALEQHQTTGISLGTVLVKLGFIDEDTLNAVLGKQLEFSYRKRIGEILVDQGYISADQLQEGLAKQKAMNLPLGKCLVKLGFIEEGKLLDVLAAQLDLQHINLENFKFLSNIVHMISEEMARSYKVIPLYEKDGVLTVAMVDPTNLRSLDHIKFKTGKDVEPVIGTEAEILSAIERAYSGTKEKLSDLIGKDVDGDLVLDSKEDKDEPEMLGDEEGRQIIKIVNLIVSEAIRQGASDIHLEPQEKNMRIRYRVDGDLMEQNPIPARLMVQIISRLKVLGGMDIAEKRRPLDGRAHIQYRGKEVDLRLSTFPVLLRARGVVEKMVIRIIDPNTEVAGLDKMRFSQAVLPVINQLVDLPDGIVLVTGPTGSGKSSTLYAFIKHVNVPGVNVVTMEDPVEKNIAGISQGQINNAAGFTFAAGIRVHPAPGSGHHHAGRDARQGDGRDGHPGRPDRPPGVLHPAHQRRGRRLHPPARHGPGALPRRPPASRACWPSAWCAASARNASSRWRSRTWCCRTSASGPARRSSRARAAPIATTPGTRAASRSSSCWCPTRTSTR